MAKCSRSIAGLLVFGMVVTVAGAGMADTGLSGPARNNFVESSFQTCFREATGAPANKAIEVAVLAQYCVCYSDQMADKLANDDLKSLDAAVATDNAALKAKMDPLMKTASETCIAKLRK